MMAFKTYFFIHCSSLNAVLKFLEILPGDGQALLAVLQFNTIIATELRLDGLDTVDVDDDTFVDLSKGSAAQKFLDLIQFLFCLIGVLLGLGVHLVVADFYEYNFISIHDVLFFLFVEDQFSTIALFQKLQKRNHFLACHIAPDDDFGFRQFR